MKLEKREITLNEQDSLRDILFLEKTLLCEYAESLGKAYRKEVRETLLDLIKENAEDFFLISDLLQKLEEENG